MLVVFLPDAKFHANYKDNTGCFGHSLNKHTTNIIKVQTHSHITIKLGSLNENKCISLQR